MQSYNHILIILYGIDFKFWELYMGFEYTLLNFSMQICNHLHFTS